MRPILISFHTLKDVPVTLNINFLEFVTKDHCSGKTRIYMKDDEDAFVLKEEYDYVIKKIQEAIDNDRNN